MADNGGVGETGLKFEKKTVKLCKTFVSDIVCFPLVTKHIMLLTCSHGILI